MMRNGRTTNSATVKVTKVSPETSFLSDIVKKFGCIRRSLLPTKKKKESDGRREESGGGTKRKYSSDENESGKKRKYKRKDTYIVSCRVEVVKIIMPSSFSEGYSYNTDDNALRLGGTQPNYRYAVFRLAQSV